ncbi:hypothetical protein K438DRAFT_1976606 [Mycena galopus ATCC 62051]|nr:hypothetical protein K438DRAFT_1976606 [Mycena galopus ATCC 62051]
MYDDYDDYSPDYYEPTYDYYDPEPVDYNPEPVYHDTESVNENEAGYSDQGFDDAPEAEGYEDFGEGFAADIPSYGLHDYLEYVGDREPSYAPEIVDTPLHIDLAHATEAEIDAAAWTAVYVHGPPPGESLDTWSDSMDAWRRRIVAGHNPGSSILGDGDVDVLEVIDRECYEREHDEWLEDEAEDRCLQAEGWAYDEERCDYWHSVHGWGEDYEPEEPSNTLSPLLDSTANADVLPPPSDFSEAPDIEQFSPLPYIAPELYELTSLEPDTYEHSHLAHATPAHVEAHLFAFNTPLRSVHREPAPIRYTMPRRVYKPRDRPPPAKHLTHCQRGYRSSSAKPASKNQRSSRRRTCSCPDFQRDPPPHLETPQPPATRDPGEPPDTPMTKVIQAAVARSATASAPPPVEPVLPDIPLSSPLGSPSSLRSGAKPARSSRAPPISIVHATALPVPPDIPRTRPSTSLSPERRHNALHRLSKKGKG